MYENKKTVRLRENVEGAEKYDKLEKENEEVEELNKKLQAEMTDVKDKYQTEIIMMDIHKMLMVKAKNHIADLEKEKKN